MVMTVQLFLPCLALLAATPLAAQPPAPPAGTGGLFLSPMGEPFRSVDSAADNAGSWFAGADRNNDGALALAELQGDAARFFATLDTNGDGEIAPGEMARYENEVAPEVQVGLQMRGTGIGDWEGRRRRRVTVFDEGLQGAGRYSFLNIPQPVIAADADMNRGVSSGEFAQAASQRFALLDSNRDGRLVRAELPPLPRPRLRRRSGEDSDAQRFWRRRPGN